MNNRYFLLRHGESLRNVKHIASCWPEKIRCPLTVEGRKQIKTSAEKLKNENIDLIFYSDLLRTKQTAEIVTKYLKIKMRPDKRLREIGVGIFNGKPINDIVEFWSKEGNLSFIDYYTNRFKLAPPRGENYTEVEDRMRDFLEDTEKKFQGKNILIVSHSRPITLIEKVVHHYSMKEFAEIVINKKEIQTGEVRKLQT